MKLLDQRIFTIKEGIFFLSSEQVGGRKGARWWLFSHFQVEYRRFLFLITTCRAVKIQLGSKNMLNVHQIRWEVGLIAPTEPLGDMLHTRPGRCSHTSVWRVPEYVPSMGYGKHSLKWKPNGLETLAFLPNDFSGASHWCSQSRGVLNSNPIDKKSRPSAPSTATHIFWEFNIVQILTSTLKSVMEWTDLKVNQLGIR